MARNMMGFKKVDGIPNGIVHREGHSIYDPLIKEVATNGGTFALDTKDNKRACSLANTLRITIKKRGYDNVCVAVRYTTVYIQRKED